MSARESDIVFESGDYWVLKVRDGFAVHKNRASGNGSEYHGTAKSLEQVKRYIERRERYERTGV